MFLFFRCYAMMMCQLFCKIRHKVALYAMGRRIKQKYYTKAGILSSNFEMYNRIKVQKQMISENNALK